MPKRIQVVQTLQDATLIVKRVIDTAIDNSLSTAFFFPESCALKL